VPPAAVGGGGEGGDGSMLYDGDPSGVWAEPEPCGVIGWSDEGLYDGDDYLRGSFGVATVMSPLLGFKMTTVDDGLRCLLGGPTTSGVLGHL
jgi:hypothetical protein